MVWSACLSEYEKLVNRINKPRVVIDNTVCETATVIKVDSARKRGVLLEAIQTLTDLNLCIKKGYISSDGRWFMDVFHVTDQFGRKLPDDSVTSYMERSLLGGEPSLVGDEGLTLLELSGTDRPGLISEVFAVLADLQCGVVDAKLWTHNGCIASLISIKEEEEEVDEVEVEEDGEYEDKEKLLRVNSRLRNILKCGFEDIRNARTEVSSAALAHAERRLHRMMVEDRDYERAASSLSSSSSPSITVQNWVDRGYSIVNVQCVDRPNLLFDVVCTLTDMDYVVFHGTIDTDGDLARQEFCIRHVDGRPISSEAEMQRVIQHLQAAVQRRTSEGVRLELCTVDRPGLLADVTRTFRENGLVITRAEITTRGGMASNVFYVKDAGGRPADRKAIEAVRERVGMENLTVWQPPVAACHKASSTGGVGLFSIGSLVRRNLFNLGLIGSCS